MDSSNDAKLAHLLRAAQRGDKAAYERFLREASLALKPYINKRMRHANQREDVLQETLLAIHRARHTYHPDRPVGPWLYAICQNRIIDFYRRQNRIETHELSNSAAEHDIAYLNEENIYSARAEKVLHLLDQLPDQQRHIIKLLKLQELSIKEIAAKVAMTESAVKVAASRGYQTIRRLFEEGRDEHR